MITLGLGKEKPMQRMTDAAYLLLGIIILIILLIIGIAVIIIRVNPRILRVAPMSAFPFPA